MRKTPFLLPLKKWIDIGGDWNPCFGPDSFQQLIAYYLAKEGIFSNDQYLRELPLLDIQFSGDIPAMGISPDKVWKHMRDHVKAMQICQSYKMQTEAKRRALLIKAHITIYKNQLSHFEIQDIKSKKMILLIDKTDQRVIKKFNYKVNWLAITFKNQYRKLAFFSYFGDGRANRKNIIITFLQYLNISNFYVRKLYLLVKKVGKACKKYCYKCWYFIKKIGRPCKKFLKKHKLISSQQPDAPQ